MKYATIKYFDVANGPGLRTSLFVSGCTHHCKGCFNEIAWDFNYGDEFTDDIQKSIIDSLKSEYIEGLTLLGGEPMERTNQRVLVPFLHRVKKECPNKTIWCFTGYLFDDLLEHGKMHTEVTDDMLSMIDVIVDGEFVEGLKDLTLIYKGSSNQRTINVRESLQKNEIVIIELKR